MMSRFEKNKFFFLAKCTNQKKSSINKLFLTLQKNKMSLTERHIIETYSMMLNGLSPLSKIEIIASLTKSLKKDTMAEVDSFYESFGAFSTEKTAEEIVLEIKSSRKFKSKEISL